MSTVGSWAYVYEFKVKPFLGQDDFTGSALYGEEYTIKGYPIKSFDLIKGGEGFDFSFKMAIYTDSSTVKIHDLIDGESVISVSPIAERPFNMEDDYRIFV